MAEAERPGGRAKEVTEESLDHLLHAVFEDEAAPEASAQDLSLPADVSPHERFRVLGRLARGDTADVLLAKDREMDREVALKVLRSEGRSDEAAAERFLERAQTSAQLHHPGIVPVYGLGVGEDGRPFYAMKLVEGRPLADLVGKTDRRRLLGVFEQVARAVAYAHARDVVHGDLCPSNVLVGRFGQAHLVGWNGASAGQAGDVRALGAMLEKQPDGDERLEAIARRCREASPSSADVAQAVSTFLGKEEARARRAELTAARECADAREARAREALERRRAGAARRARSRTVAVTVVVLVAVVLGAVGVVWKRVEDRAARTRLEAAVARAMRDATRLEKAGDWAAARARAVEAVVRARDGRGHLQRTARALLDRIDRTARLDMENATLLARLEEIRTETCLHADLRRTNAAYLAAFRRIGVDLEGPDAGDALERLRARSRPVEIAAALDHWAWLQDEDRVPSWERLLEIASALDADPRRRRLREAAIRLDHEELRRLSASADPADRHSRSLLQFGWSRAPGDVADDLCAIQRRRPDDLVVALALAGVLQDLDPPDPAGAVRCYAQAVALRPDHACAWNGLGVALGREGRRDAAFAAYEQAARRRPEHADHHANLAGALCLRRRFDEGIAAYRRALAIDGDSPQAWTGLGAALRDRDPADLGEAIRAFERALEVDPTHVDAHLGLAMAFEGLGRSHDALASYRRAVEQGPEHAEAHRRLGVALTRRDEFEKARAAFEEAIRLRPDHFAAHHDLGTLLLNRGRPEEAVVPLRMATERNPGYAGAWCNLGRAHLERGQLEEAESALRAALDLEPDHAPALTILGDLHEARREFDRALDAYQKALRAEPRLTAARLRLGVTLRNREEVEGALRELRTAVDLAPDDPDAHYELGVTYCDHVRNPARAVEAFCRAIDLDGRRPRFHIGLGLALRNLREFERSIEAYRAALALRPAPELAGAAHFGLAVTLAMSGRPDAAIEELRRAATHRPGHFPTHAKLGEMLARAGRPAEAIGPWRRALELQPGHALLRRNLAMAYLETGRLAEAAKAFRRVLEQKPGDASCWLYLAMAHARLGHGDEARTCLAKGVARMNAKAPNEGLNRLRDEAEALVKGSER